MFSYEAKKDIELLINISTAVLNILQNWQLEIALLETPPKKRLSILPFHANFNSNLDLLQWKALLCSLLPPKRETTKNACLI